MIIIKLTILFMIITLIYGLFLSTYLEGNPLVVSQIRAGVPKWYTTIFYSLIIIDTLGVLLSVTYFLFFLK